MTWPDFIVIGAPRSGTTSLHSYLGEHPDVHMSRIKEPNYFLFDGDPPRFGGPGGDMTARDSIYLERDYRALFAEGAEARVRGESSPKYLSAPGTADRIAAVLPEVKLVAILRNPVGRALSDFALRVRDGWELCATLEEALEDEPRRIRENWSLGLYRKRGFYGRQLAEYRTDLGQLQDMIGRDLSGWLDPDRARPDPRRRRA